MKQVLFIVYLLFYIVPCSLGAETQSKGDESPFVTRYPTDHEIDKMNFDEECMKNLHSKYRFYIAEEKKLSPGGARELFRQIAKDATVMAETCQNQFVVPALYNIFLLQGSYLVGTWIGLDYISPVLPPEATVQTLKENFAAAWNKKFRKSYFSKSYSWNEIDLYLEDISKQEPTLLEDYNIKLSTLPIDKNLCMRIHHSPGTTINSLVGTTINRVGPTITTIGILTDTAIYNTTGIRPPPPSSPGHRAIFYGTWLVTYGALRMAGF